MKQPTWSLDQVPYQSNKIAIVTGANTGLGFETALRLAGKGIEVIMACRNLEKAQKAHDSIKERLPQVKLRIMQLDLADLDSVREFVQQFNTHFKQLDLLVNNAGVMMPPYELTKDGFELQMGANYFGHFLLTQLLLPQLEAAPAGRVVTLASLAHKWADIYFDDLAFGKGYNPRKAYGQSKLACLMFAYELQRKLSAKGSKVISVAAHPGISATELSRHMPKILMGIAPVMMPLVAQSAAKGALPTLRAALDDTLTGGEYIGPDGFQEFKGNPVIVKSNKNSHNTDKSQRLWEVSERLTKIKEVVE